MSDKLVNWYPITKLVWLFALIVSALLLRKWELNLLLVVILLVVCVVNGVFRSIVKKMFKGFSVLILLLIVIQGLFFTSGESDIFIGPLALKSLGLQYGLNLSSVILVIGLSSFLFIETTLVKDIAYALEKQGLSKRSAYVVMASFQIIPELRQQTSRIVIAQQARGMLVTGSFLSRLGAYLPIMGTLLVSTIVATEERALTLEVRGFSTTEKSYLRELRPHTYDRWLQVLAVIIVAGLSGWQVAKWLL